MKPLDAVEDAVPALRAGGIAIRIIIGLALVAAVAFALWWLLIRPHAAQVAATAARLDTATAQAATALTQDAMSETLAVGNDHAAIDAATQENDRAIHAAPGADVALDPAVARAGRAALCLRAAYRGKNGCPAVP